MTKTSTPPATGRDSSPAHNSLVRWLIGRITRLEVIVAAVIAVFMGILVLIEPDILEAPFENAQTLLFTFGGTALAGAALVAMLWYQPCALPRVPRSGRSRSGVVISME